MRVAVGLPVRYLAHEGHHTTEERPHPDDPKKTVTVKTGGSVHHDALTEFAAIVTRVHQDGTVDLTFFPPNKEPKHVDRVAYHAAHHAWRNIDEPSERPEHPQQQGQSSDPTAPGNQA